MEKLGLNLGFLLVQIFNFAIIMVVLYAWVYKPLLNMLEKRRKTIAQGMEDARIAAEARANAERDASQITAEAQLKAAEIVREATERAETAIRDVQTAAEGKIAKMRQTAAAEIEEERNRMLSELRNEVVTLSIAAAQKLIGETLDETRQRTLLQSFFSGIKGGKVEVLEGAELSGKTAEVTSALPLTNEEQKLIKKELAAFMGHDAPKVEFLVDPSILGGVIVRVGDRVLDGSVAGQLQSLHQSLR